MWKKNGQGVLELQGVSGPNLAAEASNVVIICRDYIAFRGSDISCSLAFEASHALANLCVLFFFPFFFFFLLAGLALLNPPTSIFVILSQGTSHAMLLHCGTKDYTVFGCSGSIWRSGKRFIARPALPLLLLLLRPPISS